MINDTTAFAYVYVLMVFPVEGLKLGSGRARAPTTVDFKGYPAKLYLTKLVYLFIFNECGPVRMCTRKIDGIIVAARTVGFPNAFSFYAFERNTFHVI